jgi:hypothetical protein
MEGYPMAAGGMASDAEASSGAVSGSDMIDGNQRETQIDEKEYHSEKDNVEMRRRSGGGEEEGWERKARLFGGA